MDVVVFQRRWQIEELGRQPSQCHHFRYCELCNHGGVAIAVLSIYSFILNFQVSMIACDVAMDRPGLACDVAMDRPRLAWDHD